MTANHLSSSPVLPPSTFSRIAIELYMSRAYGLFLYILFYSRQLLGTSRALLYLSVIKIALVETTRIELCKFSTVGLLLLVA